MSKDKSGLKDIPAVSQQDETLQETFAKDDGKMFVHVQWGKTKHNFKKNAR